MELIQEIEQRLGKIAERLNPDAQYPHEDLDCTELAECIYVLAEELKWHKISEKQPSEGIPVLGYNEKWIDDANSTGIRECFWNTDWESETMWTTSAYSFSWDEYRSEHGMPTHWKSIPNFSE